MSACLVRVRAIISPPVAVQGSTSTSSKLVRSEWDGLCRGTSKQQLSLGSSRSGLLVLAGLTGNGLYQCSAWPAGLQRGWPTGAHLILLTEPTCDIY